MSMIKLDTKMIRIRERKEKEIARKTCDKRRKRVGNEREREKKKIYNIHKQCVLKVQKF